MGMCKMDRDRLLNTLFRASGWQKLFSMLVVSWLLAGCTSDFLQPSLIDYTYPAADQLFYNLGHGSVEPHLHPLRSDQSLLVASFVELDNIEKTSTFGRLVAEQMASRLTQKGFNFIELKLREKLYVRSQPGGELALSRDLVAISRQHNAQAILVGTYSVVQDFVYVSAKIVRLDGHVYAVHDFAVPKSRLTQPVAKGRYEDWQSPPQ